MSTVGIILLAAGGSARFGRPKQLLPWHGTTLIRHMANVALAAETGSVVVVLGSSAGPCAEALEGLPVRTVVNERWQEGVGGSIAQGLKTLLREEGYLRAVIVMLCDQPGVSVATLRALMKEQRSTGSLMIASSYAGTVGPPAIFGEEKFPELYAQEGNQGAKALLLAAAEKVPCIPFTDGSRDIDTLED